MGRRPGCLAALMRKVACAGGFTQIGRVLAHAKRESAAKGQRSSMSATAWRRMSTSSPISRASSASGVPVFLFQEGSDPKAERAFREIAGALARRLLPLRRGLGPAAPRASRRGRGLRHRRPQGGAEFQRRDQEHGCAPPA